MGSNQSHSAGLYGESVSGVIPRFRPWQWIGSYFRFNSSITTRHPRSHLNWDKVWEEFGQEMSPVNVHHLSAPDVDEDGKEPWAPDTVMIVPVEATQVLICESAAILGAQAFLNILKLPYRVEERPNASDISPTSKVPVLRCGAYVVSELEGIVQLAQTKGISLSEHLNTSQKADMRAYMSLVHNVLGNALLYFCWADNDIFKGCTKFRVGSPYNFPLKSILPWYFRTQAEGQLNNLEWGQRTSEQVYQQVETCLAALDLRLEETTYFFGDVATELDALVFGYLFTMVTTPLGNGNDQLGNLVKQHPTLVRFIQTLEKQYFNSSR